MTRIICESCGREIVPLGAGDWPACTTCGDLTEYRIEFDDDEPRREPIDLFDVDRWIERER